MSELVAEECIFTTEICADSRHFTIERFSFYGCIEIDLPAVFVFFKYLDQFFRRQSDEQVEIRFVSVKFQIHKHIIVEIHCSLDPEEGILNMHFSGINPENIIGLVEENVR
ncbi:hypothetical protein D3C86_1146920 [compost metagenome]